MPFISLIGCSTEQKEKNPQQLALLGVHFIIVSLLYFLRDGGISQFTGEDDEVMKNSEKIV